MTPGELAGGIGTILTAVAYAQAISANLAAVTPQASTSSPTWWRYTRAVLDVLAANAHNAANAPRPPAAAAPPTANDTGPTGPGLGSIAKFFG